MPQFNRNVSSATFRLNLARPGLAKPVVFLYLSALLILSGCGSASSPATNSGGEVLDDFSNASCPFGQMQAGSSRGYECADGEFRAWIDNDQERYDFITAPLGESYGDVRIEVDARFVSGDEAGAYILCRGSQSTGDFYFLRVSADGRVEITNYLEGEEQIARLNTVPDGAVLPGWNHIQADCIGRDLSLYLNGELVLERELEGDFYAAGDVGLGAGGGSQGFSEVRFDNLQVIQP
jgi:hypothetical protein